MAWGGSRGQKAWKLRTTIPPKVRGRSGPGWSIPGPVGSRPGPPSFQKVARQRSPKKRAERKTERPQPPGSGVPPDLLGLQAGGSASGR